jgi:hypothetical protein
VPYREQEEAMRVGPFFKWFGSKWLSARRYPPPAHRLIVEPFAGSAGYACNYPDRDVVLWDSDPNVDGLWHWLISQARPADILEIPVGLPVGADILSLDLAFGQKLLLKHWQRTNNVGDCWTTSPWGHMPGQWTESTRSRIADQLGSIKHWKIDLPINYVDVPGTWFVDPPYFWNYRYNERAIGRFEHRDVASLVQMIDRRSLVIVCEAARRSDGQVPDYLPFIRSHSSVTSRRKSTQSHHSNECVFIREPAP